MFVGGEVSVFPPTKDGVLVSLGVDKTWQPGANQTRVNHAHGRSRIKKEI